MMRMENDQVLAHTTNKQSKEKRGMTVRELKKPEDML